VTAQEGYFSVACCGVRRGILAGVLICPRCDCTPTSGIPRESEVKDIPAGVWHMPIKRETS
jgi:hypothetical protein